MNRVTRVVRSRRRRSESVDAEVVETGLVLDSDSELSDLTSLKALAQVWLASAFDPSDRSISGAWNA